MSEQPAPVQGRESVTDWLIERLKERREHGIATYGRELEAFNGRDAGQDAWEEALDLLVYLSQQRMEQAERDRRYDVLRATLRRIANADNTVSDTWVQRFAEDALREAGEANANG